MKTKNGHNWYVADLNNYTSEFLIEIIENLYDDFIKEPKRKVIEKVNNHD